MSLAIAQHEGILVVDSRLIAQELGIEHHTFLKTLNKYLVRIESRFGVVRFEVDKPLEGSSGGRPEKYALLQMNSGNSPNRRYLFPLPKTKKSPTDPTPKGITPTQQKKKRGLTVHAKQNKKPPKL